MPTVCFLYTLLKSVLLLIGLSSFESAWLYDNCTNIINYLHQPSTEVYFCGDYILDSSSDALSVRNTLEIYTVYSDFTLGHSNKRGEIDGISKRWQGCPVEFPMLKPRGNS